ncbi:hypothetical protein D6833_08650, partial [Candidatus Parcubacteria bacterium]
MSIQVENWNLIFSEHGIRLEEAQDADPTVVLLVDDDDLGVLEPVLAAVQAERWAEVWHQGRALEPSLIQDGHWGAWGMLLRWLQMAAAKLRDRPGEAWVWHQQGIRALCLGDQTTARTCLARAYRRRQQLGDETATWVTCSALDLLLGPSDELPQRSSSAAVRASYRRRGWALVAVLFLLALGLFRLWRWPSVRLTVDESPLVAQATPISTPTLVATSVPTSQVETDLVWSTQPLPTLEPPPDWGLSSS